MGRHSEGVCRLCRREGTKLFLKGSRCDTPKCAIERRDAPPGMHRWRRGKPSDYAVHLREKQKLKRYYGVFDKQFMRYFRMAERSRGNTGDVLLALLERRLDNVVHRLGFAPSRPAARQLVNHGHILVNGRRVDIASYLVRLDDRIGVRNRPKSRSRVRSYLEDDGHQVPDFLELLGTDPPEGRVVRLPDAADVSIGVQPQLIIELCSR
jgi:small subunit ribosomal protein S4